MKESSTEANLIALQRELAERIHYLGSFLDNCLGSGMGNRLLEYRDNAIISLSHEEFDLVDLSKYRVGRNLQFFYDYAYHARCTQGIDWEDWAVDGDDQLFAEFLDMTETYGVITSGFNSPQWGSITKSSSVLRRHMGGAIERRDSRLWDMIILCDARQRLDFDSTVTVSDIALLANMNEKSVRNALRDEGENKLHSLDGENIESAEALRWMRGRKSGFRETTFISFDKEELPENLRYMEIAPFIKERLEKFCDHSIGTFRYADAAERLGYSCEKIWSIVDNIDNLPFKDTHRIAKVIKVDPVWFTKQVFTALFPEQMEMILFQKEIEYEVFTDEQEKHFIEVNLTEKGIKNGYIDIPEKLSKFFPNDCFGDRAAGKQGNPIELRFGSEVRNTDIRVKSSITISPRARFGGYFNKVINAKPGDTLRIIKVDDRVFEIKHSSSS